MRLKLLFLSTALLFVISLGCASSKSLLQPSDVIISAKASPFGSVNEYHAFFGITSYASEDDEKEEMRNLIMVRINWDLTPEKRLDNTKLEYPPYIIVIQPNAPFAYAGTGNCYNGSLVSSVGSIPAEVIKKCSE